MQFLYRQFNFFACLKCHKNNQIYFIVSASITKEQVATILFLYIKKIPWAFRPFIQQAKDS